MALGDDEWLPALMARAGTFKTPVFTEAAYAVACRHKAMVSAAAGHRE